MTAPGPRQPCRSEDEPFEFFRGFSEIFVSVGLIILLIRHFAASLAGSAASP
jgi:hypothetical protein